MGGKGLEMVRQLQAIQFRFEHSHSQQKKDNEVSGALQPKESLAVIL